MTGLQIAARALSALAMDVYYELGTGGFNPAAASPATLCRRPHGVVPCCDCSGFVAWCLGIPRRMNHPFYVLQNGGRLSTQAMAAELRAGINSPTNVLHTMLDADVRPGDVVVYDQGEAIGHCGIVVGTDALAAGARPLHSRDGWLVVHCSAGRRRQPVDRAVRQDRYDDFARNARTEVFAGRYTGWVP